LLIRAADLQTHPAIASTATDDAEDALVYEHERIAVQAVKVWIWWLATLGMAPWLRGAGSIVTGWNSELASSSV